MIKTAFALSLLSLNFCVINRSAAQTKDLYSFSKKIEIPGEGGYDYLSVDDKNRHLFVSHGTEVDVIDLDKQALIGKIDGLQRVHGIAVVNSANKGFISDGGANAVVAFDLTSFNKIATIPVSGKNPDAIVYDMFSKQLYTFNGKTNNASVIDIDQLKETGTFDMGGKPEFAVPDEKGKMYDNLEDKSILAVIDTKNNKVSTNYPLTPCEEPSGLALDKEHHRAFSVCGNKKMSIVNVENGKLITTVDIGDGADAVVYDAKTKLIIASNGDGTATIIKQHAADKYTVVQVLKTVPRARTLALDPKTHTLYFSAGDFDKTTKKVKPGTFGVYAYTLSTL